VPAADRWHQLAAQLNDDVTHLQGQRLEVMVGAACRGGAGGAGPAWTSLRRRLRWRWSGLPGLVAGFAGRDGELAVLRVRSET